MADLSNEGIEIQLQKLKAFYRRNSIIIIAVIIIIVLVVVNLYFKSSSTNSTIKDLTKENKELKKEQAEMKEKFTADSLAHVEVQNQIDVMRQERELLMNSINNTTYMLSKFKPQYEKVNNYKSVPANDSLTGIFNRVFDY